MINRIFVFTHSSLQNYGIHDMRYGSEAEETHFIATKEL